MTQLVVEISNIVKTKNIRDGSFEIDFEFLRF